MGYCGELIYSSDLFIAKLLVLDLFLCYYSVILLIAGKGWRGAQALQPPPQSSPHQILLWFSYITVMVGDEKEVGDGFLFSSDALIPWFPSQFGLVSWLCTFICAFSSFFSPKPSRP